MQQMWWSPLRLMIHTEVGKWTGCGRCSIMPCVVKWPPRGTCWPGAAEWWSTRCSKGRSGGVEGWNLSFYIISFAITYNFMMDSFLLEFWRSAEKPKVTWNVLYTMPRGGRNQLPAHPRYNVLHFTVVFTTHKYHQYQFSHVFLIFPHFAERSADHSTALAEAQQEKAAAPRISDPLSSSPPSRDQESKRQQPAQPWQPGRLWQWWRGMYKTHQNTKKKQHEMIVF